MEIKLYNAFAPALKAFCVQVSEPKHFNRICSLVCALLRDGYDAPKMTEIILNDRLTVQEKLRGLQKVLPVECYFQNPEDSEFITIIDHNLRCKVMIPADEADEITVEFFLATPELKEKVMKNLTLFQPVDSEVWANAKLWADETGLEDWC